MLPKNRVPQAQGPMEAVSLQHATALANRYGAPFAIVYGERFIPAITR